MQGKIVSRRTLVAVLAHADDKSFAVGGTLAKYAVQGANVDLILATHGEAGILGKRSWEASEIWEFELSRSGPCGNTRARTHRLFARG